jgi:hypothetical protein
MDDMRAIGASNSFIKSNKSFLEALAVSNAWKDGKLVALCTSRWQLNRLMTTLTNFTAETRGSL